MLLIYLLVHSCISLPIVSYIWSKLLNLGTMKRFICFFTVLISIAGCYDDSAMLGRLDDLEERVMILEESCRQMNADISSLQTIISALQNNDYVTGVIPVNKGGEVIGYTISFSKSQPITIYHGEDGKDGKDGKDGEDGVDGKDGVNGKDGRDGYVPVVGVRQDDDGIYYWTLDGEWLLDSSGRKIRVQGTDGKDGSDGLPGQDGASGNDGVTPQLKITDGYWYVSYDNGITWDKLGPALPEVAMVDPLFKGITQDEGAVYFEMLDGTVISVPKVDSDPLAGLKSLVYVPRYDDGKALVVVANDGSSALVELDMLVSPFNLAERIAENYEQLLHLKAVVTVTRASEFHDLTIESCEAKDGVLTISACIGEVFQELHTQALSVVVIAGNPGNEVVSEFIPLTLGGEIPSPDEPEVPDTPVVPDGPSAMNVLKYTVSDGRALSPYVTDGFGAVFIENRFDSSTSSGELVFDGTVTTIPPQAFDLCDNMTSIVIPESVTTIGSMAFVDCTSLQDIIIPSSVVEIGASAFRNCTGRLKIECNIPKAFSGDTGAFALSGFSEVEVAEGVTVIGAYSFYNCARVERMVLPETLKSIGDYAFYNCVKIKELTLSSSLTSFGSKSFEGCTFRLYLNCNTPDREYWDGLFVESNLSEAVIGEGVKKIGDNTFNECRTLTRVSLPKSLEEAGNSAFGSCVLLERVDIADITAWCGVNFKAGGNPMENAIYLESGQKVYVDGVLTTEVVIDDSVSSIKDNAFYGFKNMTKVVLSKRVEYIGAQSFACSGITEVVIPDRCRTIAYNAFSTCEHLSHVTIGSSVTEIQSWAFSYNPYLTEVYCKPLVPPTMGWEVFLKSSNLAKIYVPREVVDAYMFADGWNEYASLIHPYDF